MEKQHDDPHGQAGSGKRCGSHRYLAGHILRYPGLVIVRKPEDTEYRAELLQRLGDKESPDAKQT